MPGRPCYPLAYAPRASGEIATAFIYVHVHTDRVDRKPIRPSFARGRRPRRFERAHPLRDRAGERPPGRKLNGQLEKSGRLPKSCNEKRNAGSAKIRDDWRNSVEADNRERGERGGGEMRSAHESTGNLFALAPARYAERADQKRVNTRVCPSSLSFVSAVSFRPLLLARLLDPLTLSFSPPTTRSPRVPPCPLFPRGGGGDGGGRWRAGTRKRAEKIGNRCEIALARCMPGNQDYLRRALSLPPARRMRARREKDEGAGRGKGEEESIMARGHKIPRRGMRAIGCTAAPVYTVPLRSDTDKKCSAAWMNKSAARARRSSEYRARRTNYRCKCVLGRAKGDKFYLREIREREREKRRI